MGQQDIPHCLMSGSPRLWEISIDIRKCSSPRMICTDSSHISGTRHYSHHNDVMIMNSYNYLIETLSLFRN